MKAIVIGDSTNNTLSIIRSLGEAKIDQCLILKCENDTCLVGKSKYLKNSEVFHILNMDECLPILERLKDTDSDEHTIICSFDEAAVFVDNNEEYLSQLFRTPARGKHIGKLFEKDEQCKLAEECGLTVPKTRTFNRNDNIYTLYMEFPVLLKPQNSIRGEKSDIHICGNIEDVSAALKSESHCDEFILQEFIEKDFELDCIGVRTEKGMYIPGGIRKIRHYPPLIGAGAFGQFLPVSELGIELDKIELFLSKAGYYGPFSIEFLRRGNRNYFMEVNFRNEGLAYAATVAGANLHAMYLNPNYKIDQSKILKVYMMNYSIDFLYVKSKEVSLLSWICDFCKTSCFINFSRRDPMPTIYYYINKFRRIFKK